eukprot:2661740-Amphidinium_carterae.1
MDQGLVRQCWYPSWGSSLECHPRLLRSCQFCHFDYIFVSRVMQAEGKNYSVDLLLLQCLTSSDASAPYERKLPESG